MKVPKSLEKMKFYLNSPIWDTDPNKAKEGFKKEIMERLRHAREMNDFSKTRYGIPIASYLIELCIYLEILYGEY